MTARPKHDRPTDHPPTGREAPSSAQTPATPNTTRPDAPHTEEAPTGRESVPREACGRMRPGYPGRDRLDQAQSRLRAKLKALARESVADEPLRPALAAIVDAACAEFDRLTAAADQALAGSARHQAGIRRELAKMQRLARQAPAGRGRELAEATVAELRSQLVEVEL